MFKTHYAKQRLKNGKILSVIEGFLYQIADSETLFTEQDLFDKYIRETAPAMTPEGFHNVSRHWTKNPKDISAIIKELVMLGYFKEVHGNRIDTMLSTF